MTYQPNPELDPDWYGDAVSCTDCEGGLCVAVQRCALDDHRQQPEVPSTDRFALTVSASSSVHLLRLHADHARVARRPRLLLGRGRGCCLDEAEAAAWTRPRLLLYLRRFDSPSSPSAADDAPATRRPRSHSHASGFRPPKVHSTPIHPETPTKQSTSSPERGEASTVAPRSALARCKPLEGIASSASGGHRKLSL